MGCLLGMTQVQGQGFSLRPFQLEPSPQLRYIDGNYVEPPPPGKTNWHRVHNSGLQYGDRIRLRTVGSFGVKPPEAEEFGSDGPQPFVGFFTGVMLRPNQYFHPAPLEDAGAPRYVTPPVEVNGKIQATDVELDFLITPGGIDCCVPVGGNFLGMVNADPRVQARDQDGDFRVEVIPLEGSRVQSQAILSSTNVTVGDLVEMTLTFTNSGNASAFGLRMYDLGYDPMEHDTNLVEILSGPVPASLSSIPPGGFAKIDFQFRAIGPGLNRFYSRVGQTVCGDQFYQAHARQSFLTINPIIDVTPRRPSLETYATESLEAAEADAPLRFVDDDAVLAAAPAFAGRGLIADGVTPLLLRLEIPVDKLERFPTEVTLRAEASLVSGEVTGTPVNDRLERLKDGAWTAGGEITLGKEKPVAFVALKPFRSDELVFAARQVEISVRVAIRDKDGLTLGSVQLLVRRPPVALIHGYNTNGDWGTDFLNELGRSRGTSLIQVARYGQEEITSPTTGSQASVNTIWPLANLAPLAERAFRKAMEPVAQEWLFTRHDVVAHSQGGLLTRMLCSRHPNPHVPLPFRNEENFYRGRFHRVVTIGSPHNGTRLLRYLLTLNQNEGNALPSWVGYGMVSSDTAQEKFDPWGTQIRELNDPDPGSKWAPDPAAMFHLVRTVVHGGRTFADEVRDCPALWALGIDTPGGGAIVISEGADGVVDYASMHANASFAADPPNGYTVPPENRISHAFYEVTGLGEIFGATSGQVLSVLVARHVVAALDQDAAIPAAERRFGPFQLPPLLDDTTRDAIDGMARSFNGETREAEFALLLPHRAALHGSPAPEPVSNLRDFPLRFLAPPDLPVTNRIVWAVQLFTTNGISNRGFQIRPPSANPAEITIRVSPGVYGDLVVEGMYPSSHGKRAFLKPYLVATLAPPGVVAERFQVVPGDQSAHPSGIAVPIEIWSDWSDGRRTRRLVNYTNLTVVSSDPAVVNVANPLLWRTGLPGEATITMTFGGMTSSATWTVFDADDREPSGIPLDIVSSGSAKVTLSWPSASGSGFVLQGSERLGAGVVWRDAPGLPSQVGDRFVIEVPVGPNAHFFRLQRP